MAARALGVKTIIDLREEADETSIIPAGVRYVRIPVATSAPTEWTLRKCFAKSRQVPSPFSSTATRAATARVWRSPPTASPRACRPPTHAWSFATSMSTSGGTARSNAASAASTVHSPPPPRRRSPRFHESTRHRLIRLAKLRFRNTWPALSVKR